MRSSSRVGTARQGPTDLFLDRPTLPTPSRLRLDDPPPRGRETRR